MKSVDAFRCVRLSCHSIILSFLSNFGHWPDSLDRMIQSGLFAVCAHNLFVKVIYRWFVMQSFKMYGVLWVLYLNRMHLETEGNLMPWIPRRGVERKGMRGKILDYGTAPFFFFRLNVGVRAVVQTVRG